MKLLVTELKGTITQTVVPDNNTNVQAVRLALYKHNNPAGTFKVEIRNSQNKLIAVSNEILATDISDSDYYHGLIRFDVPVFLKKNTEYSVVLTSTGYEFSESAYIGWCNSFDLASYEASYDVLNNVYSPLRLEIWAK